MRGDANRAERSRQCRGGGGSVQCRVVLGILGLRNCRVDYFQFAIRLCSVGMSCCATSDRTCAIASVTHPVIQTC
jgi:hypothetical protein